MSCNVCCAFSVFILFLSSACDNCFLLFPVQLLHCYYGLTFSITVLMPCMSTRPLVVLTAFRCVSLSVCSSVMRVDSVLCLADLVRLWADLVRLWADNSFICMYFHVSVPTLYSEQTFCHTGHTYVEGNSLCTPGVSIQFTLSVLCHIHCKNVLEACALLPVFGIEALETHLTFEPVFRVCPCYVTYTFLLRFITIFMKWTVQNKYPQLFPFPHLS